jgi:hypothetical protein
MLIQGRIYVTCVRNDVLGWAYFHQDGRGETIITIGRALAPECERLLDYRPVLFDARGRRHLPECERSTRSVSENGDRVTIDRFRIGPDRLPFDAIARVGIERMTPEVCRVAARDRDSALGPVPITFPSPDPFSEEGRRADPGCTWALAPRPVGRGDWNAAVAGPGGGVVCDVSTTRAGALAIYLAYRSSTQILVLGEPVLEYRPVLFDADGHRRVLAPLRRAGQSSFSSSHGGLPVEGSEVAMSRYLIDPDAWPGRSGTEGVALIGVEQLSPQALRAARLESFLAAVRDREGRMDGQDRERRSRPKPPGEFEVLWGTPDAVYLGAYDVLRGHAGERVTSPGSLRAGRIADFERHMAILERNWGPHFASRVETPLLDAHEITRRRPGRPLDGHGPMPPPDGPGGDGIK